MKYFICFSLCLLAVIAIGQENGIVYEFEKSTLTENGWAVISGGFTQAEPGLIATVELPSDSIPSSLDKKGLLITVQPNQVAFLYAEEPIETGTRPIVIRLTVRAGAKDASVTLATLRGRLSETDGSIATHMPVSAAGFVDKEKSLVLVYEPDAGEFVTPVIQVAATGAGTATVYIDRLEAIRLDTQSAYSGTLFGSNSLHWVDITPAPEPTGTPTGAPTPTVVSNTPTPPAQGPTPTPAIPVVAFNESEPNNAVNQSQNLNRLDINTDITITGRVNTGGLSNGNYIGDIDFYTFTLPALADVTISLDWTEQADLDFGILYNGTLTYQTDSNRPAQLKAPSPEGTYVLLIASKNNPADYRCTISARTVVPAYPNNVSILNGRFFQDPSSILLWYNFDGLGNYDYWTFNPISGSDSRQQAGRYTIDYPYLLLQHDGIVEKYYLVFVANNAFTLNGIQYIRE